MREEAQEKRSTNESIEKEAKKVRFNQESEYTVEDKAFQQDIFGPEEPENKRKEDSEEQVAPDSKRRRTQEEEDWYDDLWTKADRTSRHISLVERSEIEDRVDRWIQEIERAAVED
eukprot:11575306-Karenia_brevis.AAC.1